MLHMIRIAVRERNEENLSQLWKNVATLLLFFSHQLIAKCINVIWTLMLRVDWGHSSCSSGRERVSVSASLAPRVGG